MKQVKQLQLGDEVALRSDVDPKLHQSAAAPVFDATQNYPAGYHVTYNGYLYRFTSAHAAGAWTGNDVVLDNMTSPDAMLDLTSAGFLRVVSADGTVLWMQNTLSASRSEIAADFSTSAAYSPPALVVYNNTLYRCTAAHPAGAWNATHFTPATVQDVLALMNTEIGGKASTADATLNERGYTAWELSEYTAPGAGGPIVIRASGSGWYPCCLSVCGMSKSIGSSTTSVTWAAGEWTGGYSMTAERANSASAWAIVTPQALQDGYEVVSGGSSLMPVHPESYGSVKGNAQSTSLTWAGAGPNKDWPGTTDLVATRTALQGYVLGSQTDKLLASEAEAEALRTGKANDSAVVHKGGDTMTGTLTMSGASILAYASGSQSPGAVISGNGVTGNKLATQNVSLSGSTFTIYADQTYTVRIPLGNGTLALTANIPYSLVTKTVANGAVTLDDHACNYVDATSLAALDIEFPAYQEGKMRDFLFAVECGATPPNISYASYITIMAEDADMLVPEEGMNVYSFTEFRQNKFIAHRKTIVNAVVNVPQTGEQLLDAMRQKGISTTGVNRFGQAATALGLSDTATPQDAIDAIMN